MWDGTRQNAYDDGHILRAQQCYMTVVEERNSSGVVYSRHFSYHEGFGEHDLYWMAPYKNSPLWLVSLEDGTYGKKAYFCDFLNRYTTGADYQYQQTFATYSKVATVDDSGGVHQYKGDYVNDITDISGTYPSNGIASDGYWYVLKTS